jgi:homoserine kinase type II
MRATCCAVSLGAFKELRGIQGGIENTNYFLTTDQGEWVLTLFERLTEQLPFYLYLMKHLALAGIPCRTRRPSHERRHPAQGLRQARRRGQPPARQEPAAAQAVHCAAVGDMLARMHLAGRLRPPAAQSARPALVERDRARGAAPSGRGNRRLLRAELAFQNHVAASPSYAALPRGPIHADLFRDNVMFDGEADRLFRLLLSPAWTPGCSTWPCA